MTGIFRIFAMICGLILMSAPTAPAGERLVIFAAASLKEALDETTAAWPGSVAISYGGSGLLARQVAQGAPADLVLLANTAWMDWLESQGFPRLETRRVLLSNRLVLIGPDGSPPLEPAGGPDILARLAGGRLAIGNTKGVPAGIYGRQWLEHIGAWRDVQPALAESENVRAALALVSRGETPLGVVYASDARAEPAVTVVHDIPADSHDPISYPLAVIDGKNIAQARELAKFLSSDASDEVFLRHGFQLPEVPR